MRSAFGKIFKVRSPEMLLAIAANAPGLAELGDAIDRRHGSAVRGDLAIAAALVRS